jgi:hypothetical protein
MADILRFLIRSGFRMAGALCWHFSQMTASSETVQARRHRAYGFPRARELGLSTKAGRVF